MVNSTDHQPSHYKMIERPYIAPEPLPAATATASDRWAKPNKLEVVDPLGLDWEERLSFDLVKLAPRRHKLINRLRYPFPSQLLPSVPWFGVVSKFYARGSAPLARLSRVS